jgi:hypothetical protein
VSLSVSPPVVEILLSPNKKVTQTFTLQTTGDNLTITPEIHLAKPSDSEGHVTIDPNPLNPTSIPLSVTIAGPSTSPTLTFEAANIDAPQDVYLALVFRTTPLESTVSNLTSTSPAISSLIFVTITPTGILPISVEIADFAPPVIHDTWNTFTITPTLLNHTSTMIRPLGTYTIISPSGQTVFSLPFYPNLILGNGSRRILGSHSRSVDAGDLSPLPLSWSPSWYQVGPYRLHLTITSQGGTKLTEVEKVIWLLPLRLSIFCTLGVLLLLTLYFRFSPKKS